MQFDSLWDQLIYNAVYYGVSPWIAVLRSGDVMYWPFLATSLGVALLLRWWRPAWVAQAFSRRVWWSRSSRADYVYYVVNGTLYPALIAGLLVTAPSLGDHLAAVLRGLFGEVSTEHWGLFSIQLAYTFVYFLLYDFGRFLAHWIQHKNAFLWRFHQVHHSAEVLNPLTAFRTHPVDLAIMSLGETLFAAIGYGVFAWAFPGRFGFFIFLGAHVLLLGDRLLGTLRHTHVWLSFGPLNRIFVSPAMHQIHHSYLPQHRDRNMGFVLSIWDQWFGTAYLPQRQEVFPMGLGDGQDDGRWHSLFGMYVEPLKSAWRLLSTKLRPPVT